MSWEKLSWGAAICLNRDLNGFFDSVDFILSHEF